MRNFEVRLCESPEIHHSHIHRTGGVYYDCVGRDNPLPIQWATVSSVSTSDRNPDPDSLEADQVLRKRFQFFKEKGIGDGPVFGRASAKQIQVIKERAGMAEEQSDNKFESANPKGIFIQDHSGGFHTTPESPLVKPAENRSLPVRWADRAMFQAEPIDVAEGPRVYLLWMTPDPLGAIAAACKMYKGEVVRSLTGVTDVERLEFFEQVQKTKLKAPFEFVKFHFMIEGVTRAFTHQMVRQRTAVYAQESMRFAVPTGEDVNLPVRLPPSLTGTNDAASRLWGTDEGVEPSSADHMRAKWDDCVNYIDEVYSDLVEMGMPAEDARGLLPTNTLTRLHYSTDLRALLDHAGNRLCTQAQFEWRLVFARIIEAIREANTSAIQIANGSEHVYMADHLSGLFKPVCYQTGKCEFKANFDRACSIRDRVDSNAAINRPSSEWGKDLLTQEIGIQAIKPGEWLLNPGAAR